MKEGEIKIIDKLVIYGLDDECFLIADTIVADGYGLGVAKQFDVYGDLFQVDTETNEVVKMGRRGINYTVQVNAIFDPKGE